MCASSKLNSDHKSMIIFLLLTGPKAWKIHEFAAIVWILKVLSRDICEITQCQGAHHWDVILRPGFSNALIRLKLWIYSRGSQKTCFQYCLYNNPQSWSICNPEHTNQRMLSSDKIAVHQPVQLDLKKNNAVTICY